MGFAYDTVITDETMFYSIGFEQELKNILREAGKSDFVDLEKQAVNVIIRDLKARGIDYTDVSNTRDFVFEVIFYVLMTLYRGEEPDALGRRMKFNEYKEQWQQQVATRVIVLASTGETITNEAFGLPCAGNQDEGAWFKTWENRGEKLLFTGVIKAFDKNFFNRPV